MGMESSANPTALRGQLYLRRAQGLLGSGQRRGKTNEVDPVIIGWLSPAAQPGG